MFRYILLKENEYVEVKLEGDLDIDVTEVVEEELIPSLEDFNSVNLNFKDVPFVDSSGIGIFLQMIKTLEQKGIKVVVSHVKEEVMEVFNLLQIPEIIGEELFV
ncbi:STAS domain-containing protein [Ferdinandcohnia quinoae]|uniref:Anti-sigma factor antagonist n=1 Tax=Fredinandcohnia quinoae TaxID=2918902 RepID=A0AAW5E0E2_9BACI|nr:STAS domain-containing protein [Fredinandcohnia sp. SECRCQ15]MCH1625049.1 STAS domain-containing protein [Fredinandcohnia sp. SECRCQ15]